MMRQVLLWLCGVWFLQNALGLEELGKAFDLSKSKSGFTWSDVGGTNYLTSIKMETSPRYCKSSWALTVTSALADRLKIAGIKAGGDVVLSPQVLLNCAIEGGCSKGSPLDALEYIKKEGIPHESCQNYEGQEGTCNALGICRDCKHGDADAGEPFFPGHCFTPSKYPLYTVEEYTVIERYEGFEPENAMIRKMMNEIQNGGTITCEINPTQEFVEYKEGILSGEGSESTGIHYVNLVGWGMADDGSSFWIGRNCWGKSWGLAGFFNVKMGSNSLGIENRCYYGTPKVKTEEIDPEVASWLNEGEEEEEDRGLYRVRKQPAVGKPCECIKQPEDFVNPKPRLSNPNAINGIPPKSYDIRNIDGRNLATVVKNQHIPQYCGSCWIFAPLSALADRFALMYGESLPVFDFSNQIIMNCIEEGRNSCGGGWPMSVYTYAYFNGIPHESCGPYEAVGSQSCGDFQKCKICEENGLCDHSPESDNIVFRISDFGYVFGKAMLKHEIYTGGPVTCLVLATDEFLAYSGGIYNSSIPADSVNHAIEVAGWGEEDGIEYWIIRNSWGTAWGEDGWARIAMGVGDMGITTQFCVWADPKPLSEPIPYQITSIPRSSEIR